MDKKEALAYLRAAKSSLVQWKSHVQGYSLGLPVDARHLPLIHTDSFFGQWYYTEGQSLASLPSYDEINPYLEEAFQRFRNLHKLVETPPEKAGIFGSQNKLDNSRKEEIKRLTDDFFYSVQKLIDMTAHLEHDAMHLGDEEFEQLI